ncbi:MAG: alpha/beta hydrolase [Actinomycetota bacterium]
MYESVMTPVLPRGYHLDLPGRGRTFIRDIAGPPGAPTLMLLHGWTATADLNWFTCFDALSEHFRVIAPDHRGHGRGIRHKRPFRLEDCADDAAAIADVLGIHSFIPVGYSMGGIVAQLMWRRHQTRVRGLVLCSTAGYFSSSREERLSFLGLSGLAALARVTPAQTTDWLTDQIYLQRKSDGFEPWAMEQMASHDWRNILTAGRTIGAFNSGKWLKDVDVPASVIVTTEDTVVPPARQRHLYQQLRDVQVYEIEADHNAVYSAREQFVPTLLEACTSVYTRSLK